MDNYYKGITLHHSLCSQLFTLILLITFVSYNAVTAKGNGWQMVGSVPVKGKILSEKDKQPISGANVRIKGNVAGLTTDSNGQFELNVPIGSTLIITHISYLKKEIIINENTPSPLIITLQSRKALLNEVVVSTGYRNIPEERATGSFTKINNELFNRRVSTDIISRLEGVSNGLLFDHRKGGQASISIRGRSTIYANDKPLIILDNFPYEGDINNINPNDVESITILKDAAAASIWGVRAGNGVIVITTKKGSFNTPLQTSFNINTTIKEKPDIFYYPQMGSSDFIDVEAFLFNKGFYDGDIANTFTMPVLSPVVEILTRERNGQLSSSDAMEQINSLRNYDVRNDFEKYFYRKAVNQQYALSLQGGGNNISYRLSAGYDKNQDNLIANQYERISLRSENTFKPVKNLNMHAGIIYTQSKTQVDNPGGYGTIFSGGGGKFLYPYARFADEKGNPLAIVKDFRASYKDTAGGGKLLDWKYRPLEELALGNNVTKSKDLLINLGLKYYFTNTLNVSIKYQYEKSTDIGRNYHDPQTYYSRNLINLYTQVEDNSISYGIPPGGILEMSNRDFTSCNVRAQLNFDRTWGQKHQLVAIAGAELRQTHSYSNSSGVYGYNDDMLTFSYVDYLNYYPIYDNLSYSAPVPGMTAFRDNMDRFISIYSNAAYTYDNRYTISASARKDASNLFGVKSNQKWIPLWSGGISWNISNEKFYNMAFLPYLKLRATYGFNGNIDKSVTALTTAIYSTNRETGAKQAIIRNPPNPNLRWERVRILNLGLDFQTKQDCISGSVEYYRKRGLDLISTASIDPTAGLTNNGGSSSLRGNVANTQGHGIELTLNTINVNRKFKWNTALILNRSINKVTTYEVDAPPTSFLSNGTRISPLEGKPVYAIFSYAWAGLDSHGDPIGFVEGKESRDYGAIIHGEVSDLVYNGPALPTTYGALRNTFRWMGFSLSTNIIYKLGHYFRKPSLNYNELFISWNGHKDFKNRWQKPGDEKTTYVPSLVYPADPLRDQFYVSSEVLVEKADNIRLQDIQLSYDMNKDQWSMLPVRHIKLYLYANNIGIIWRANKSGIDPDYITALPSPFAVSLGLKCNF